MFVKFMNSYYTYFMKLVIVGKPFPQGCYSLQVHVFRHYLRLLQLSLLQSFLLLCILQHNKKLHHRTSAMQLSQGEITPVLIRQFPVTSP
jgi:hypothetical protein